MNIIVRTLSFTIHVVDLVDNSGETEPGRPYRCVEARPLADGIPLLKGYVFDIGPLIGYGLRDTDADLYTCGCGVAGCAGIHDYVKLRAEAAHMTWTFPEEPFRKELADTLFPAGAALTLRFEKAQYQQVLADLEAQLLSLAADGGAPVDLAAGGSFPNLEKTLKEKLERFREYADDRLARDAFHRELFGELLDQRVRVQFPNGAVRAIPVISLAYSLACDEQERTNIEPDDFLEDDLVPAWKAEPAKLFDAARGLSWDDARQLMYWTDESTDEAEPVEAQWSAVELSLERSSAD